MPKSIMLVLLMLSLVQGDEFEQKGSLVYDSRTELSWVAKPTTRTMPWQEAKSYCKALGMRLPNLYELKSLVDYSREEKAIRTDLIEIQTNDWYWTATPYDTSSAWVVYFDNGYDSTSLHTHTGCILCVSGQ